MAATFNRALARFIAESRPIVAVHDFTTKWRIELRDEYYLDLFFNETLGKHGYTLVLRGSRIIGWDNAPHHPGIANYPHHVHYLDSRIEPSPLTGDPEIDLVEVSKVVDSLLSN